MEITELQELMKLLKKYRKMYETTMSEVDDIQQITANIEAIIINKAYTSYYNQK